MNSTATSEQNRQKTLRILAFSTLAWTASVALVVFGPMLFWPDQPTMDLVMILLNLGLGIAMLLVNRRYILNLDELQRKIQLEAMAWALGLAVVGGLAYSLLDIRNVIPFDAEISFLVIGVSLTYLGGLLYGQYRYR